SLFASAVQYHRRDNSEADPGPSVTASVSRRRNNYSKASCNTIPPCPLAGRKCSETQDLPWRDAQSILCQCWPTSYCRRTLFRLLSPVLMFSLFYTQSLDQN